MGIGRDGPSPNAPVPCFFGFKGTISVIALSNKRTGHHPLSIQTLRPMVWVFTLAGLRMLMYACYTQRYERSSTTGFLRRAYFLLPLPVVYAALRAAADWARAAKVPLATARGLVLGVGLHESVLPDPGSYVYMCMQSFDFPGRRLNATCIVLDHGCALTPAALVGLAAAALAAATTAALAGAALARHSLLACFGSGWALIGSISQS